VSDASRDVTSAASLEPEDLARANFYGLISRLFYGPADANFLAEICRSGDGGPDESEGELVAAWWRLQEACRSAYPAILRQEYDSLFVGVGRAEVTPYLSGYAEPSAPDRYLVRLREQLSAWGLARKEQVFEVEDHISGICDTLRWLIEDLRPLSDQRRFFEEFAYGGVVHFCAAVHKSPSASFYKEVAALAESFFELEKAAFEMSDAA
jgi:TorA maturation chaperone TorD